MTAWAGSELTTSTAQVSDKYRFDAFGVELPGGKMSPNAYKNLNNPFGYNGEMYDHEAGLSYMRNRNYEPETGRFTTRDQLPGHISEPLSMNAYAYVSNNPLQFMDPLGLEKKKRSGIRINGVEVDLETGILFKAGLYASGENEWAVIADLSREEHYDRNKFNQAPPTLRDLLDENSKLPDDKKWRKLSPLDSLWHLQGKDGLNNVKYVSADGHYEAVYNNNGILLTENNDPANMGSYNYVDPSDYDGHKKQDVDPYIEYGNSQNDPSSYWDRQIWIPLKIGSQLFIKDPKGTTNDLLNKIFE